MKTEIATNGQSKKTAAEHKLIITREDFATLDVIFLYCKRQCITDDKVLMELINFKQELTEKLKKINIALAQHNKTKKSKTTKKQDSNSTTQQNKEIKNHKKHG